MQVDNKFILEKQFIFDVSIKHDSTHQKFFEVIKGEI